MKRNWLAGLACISLLAVNTSAWAILAFPGAEGVAKDVSGGRGSMANPGDVYIVTTLEDYDPDDDPDFSTDRQHPFDSAETPIVGSLRHGILTAPSTGRTIVFTVGGQIDLHDSLRFDGKSNITIAGQTAPGGGITLAKHDMNINNANNVIVQHVRIRPGDRTSANHPNPAYAPGPQYDPDALWVETSSNVMIDHVSASWAVDETISTTHGSDNVTIQWSMIYQPLYNGGHTEGPDHAYGSLINGHDYTYHHNFYAHTNSRAPRPQISSGNELHLDWVNNVIYNPHDQFGNSSGNQEYYMNYVGNYGLKGPETNDSIEWLMSPGTQIDTPPHIYHPGNFVDWNRDGILNGTAATASDVVRTGHAYTNETSRLFPELLPETNMKTAQQAYIQVLSRAGVTNYRDPIDHRAIRSALNHMGDQIETQADVGGYPTLPGGSPLPDSNSDGVPDAWATANGFNTGMPLNATFAPDGYSYLEKYIHSLTPFAYSPVNTVEHTIRTSYGNGADAQVNENGGLSATSSGNGTGSAINVHWDGSSGSTNQAMVLRFDLSELQPGSIDFARLDLTAAANITGTHQFKVYGLEHDDDSWDWNESTVQFNNAPGLVFDGNSRTLGIDPRYTANGNPGTQTNSPLPAAEDLITLGTFTIGSTSAGQTVSFDNLNLAVFLNLAAFYESDDMAGLATIVIEQIASSSAASFYSHEGSETFAPRLILDAIMAEAPELLVGDYNGDGKVSAADYTVWRDTLGSTTDLRANGDDSNSVIDLDDYQVWLDNYGNTSEGGSGSSVGSTAVPEPGAIVLLAFASIAWLCGSPRRWRKC
jgi:hypothetical protein